MVSSHMITHMQLADGLAYQTEAGGRIGRILLEQGAISESDFAAALSRHLGIPLVDLADAAPATGARRVLPEAAARRETAVPIRADEKGVTVAVADPTPEVAAAVRDAATRPVRIAVAPRSDVERAIDAAYRAHRSREPRRSH